MKLRDFTLLVLFLAASDAISTELTSDNPVRYRGNYTVGHEVNSFCPQINSQCYWLSPKTPHTLQQQLKALSNAYQTKVYDAVCVVIEGRIDRASERQGFAADYDGLIVVSAVYDACSKTNLVVQGDLQHHRWVLNSINNAPVNTRQFKTMPSLDFGDQMFVAANDGCRQFSANAKLDNKMLVFQQVEMIKNACVTDSGLSDSLALNEKYWLITIPEPGILKLQSNELELGFKLNDWR